MVNSVFLRYQGLMIDPLSSLPGYALRRASAAMLTELNARLEPLGVRHIDAAILVLIGANPGVTQSRLCRALDIERANMVPVISRLEAKALLRREPVDGRSHGLFFTDAGALLFKNVQQAMAAHEAALIARVAKQDRDALSRALASLWQ